MRTKYKKKIKNGKEYFFYRLRHENLEKPKDLYAKTTKDLDKKIKELNNLLDKKVNIKSERFKESFENWLYNIKFINIKNTSKELYINAYNVHIKNKPITKTKILELNREKVQELYNQLKKENTGYEIFKIIDLLIKGFVRFLYDNDMIIKDFSRALILPRKDKGLNKKNHAMTKKQQKIFIEYIKGHSMETIFLVALYTGMRQSEITALTWEDINLEKCTININKIAKYQKVITENNENEYKILVQTPKTKNSIRKIEFPKELAEKLKQHKKKQKEYKILSGGTYNKNNLVFCNKKGEYYIGGTIYTAFKICLKRINSQIKNKEDKFNNFTFHDLRHTYATRMFELKTDPKTVQTLLGHSNISITLNTYTHVMKEVQTEAIEKLNELYKELK